MMRTLNQEETIAWLERKEAESPGFGAAMGRAIEANRMRHAVVMAAFDDGVIESSETLLRIETVDGPAYADEGLVMKALGA